MPLAISWSGVRSTSGRTPLKTNPYSECQRTLLGAYMCAVTPLPDRIAVSLRMQSKWGPEGSSSCIPCASHIPCPCIYLAHFLIAMVAVTTCSKRCGRPRPRILIHARVGSLIGGNPLLACCHMVCLCSIERQHHQPTQMFRNLVGTKQA